jgi:hypothetical protein
MSSTVVGIALISAVMLSLAPKARGDLVGHWYFVNSNYTESTGNWGDVEILKKADTAYTKNGLRLFGTATRQGAARARGYTGPTIGRAHSIVSCFKIESFQANGGSVVTLDKESTTDYEGIHYSLGDFRWWWGGSSTASRQWRGQRQEAAAGPRLLIARTSKPTNDGTRDAMNLYREQFHIGSKFTTDTLSWAPGDTQVVWGRPYAEANSTAGAVDITLHETWVYNHELSAGDVLDHLSVCRGQRTAGPPTLEPIVPVALRDFRMDTCDTIDDSCDDMATQCTLLSALATPYDDCLTSVSACRDVAESCRSALNSCPIV